ncbi:MAG: transposase [Pirellulales bacterium]|nr:transposase [Pirellulales bacterium]
MSKRRQIIDDQLYAHFITFSVDRHRRLLDHDQPKRILLGVLDEELRQRQTKCVGFVILPDHVHAIVWFPAVGQLSAFMHGWKRKASFHIRNWYRAEAAHYFEGFGEGERFWTPKYFSFEIYGRAKLLEKVQYMHENPVRKGLVARAADWKWSSARWYEERRSVGVPIEWIE